MGTGEWAGNILYNIKASGAWDKRLLYFQFLPALPGVAATYLGILLPARLVEGLENHWEMERLAAWLQMEMLLKTRLTARQPLAMEVRLVARP